MTEKVQGSQGSQGTKRYMTLAEAASVWRTLAARRLSASNPAQASGGS